MYGQVQKLEFESNGNKNLLHELNSTFKLVEGRIS
jgi:hypothetical protein